MSGAIELAYVDETVRVYGSEAEALIPILQAMQEHYGYLPEEALRHLCDSTAITAEAVSGVASFYDSFELLPSGQHRIAVCHGTACHVKGAGIIFDAFARHMKLEPGQTTDEEGLFTLGKVACLGCCTLAPAVRIDEVTYGHVSSDGVERVLGNFLDRAARDDESSGPKLVVAGEDVTEVRVGLGSCCVAGGSGAAHLRV